MEIDWSSIEVDCWSRDFDYQQYLTYIRRMAKECIPVSEKEYYNVCKVCEKDYFKFFEGCYD